MSFAAIDVDLFGQDRPALHVALPSVDAGTLARFMAKVDKRPGGCWIWTGALTRDVRYGRFKVDGFVWNAHRWSYTAHVGDIPEGMFIDHLCRVRECVNPDHLEAVTPHENSRRRPHSGAVDRSVCVSCGQTIPGLARTG